MEALASGGSIYLSEPTAKLARLYFALEDLGEFTLKGVSEPMHVYELTGADPKFVQRLPESLYPQLD